MDNENVVTTEEMESIGFALDRMTMEQLHLVKNKIEQIIFERVLEGKTQYAIKIEKDESSPIGIKIELPPELQEMIAKSTEEMQKAMAELNDVTEAMGKVVADGSADGLR